VTVRRARREGGRPRPECCSALYPHGATPRSGLLRLAEPNPLVGLGRDRLERLVDRPGALLRLRRARLVGIERGVNDAERMSPLLSGPPLEGEAAVRAVVTNSRLVPRPVVLLACYAEVVRRLGARAGSLDRVAALAAAARA